MRHIFPESRRIWVDCRPGDSITVAHEKIAGQLGVGLWVLGYDALHQGSQGPLTFRKHRHKDVVPGTKMAKEGRLGDTHRLGDPPGAQALDWNLPQQAQYLIYDLLAATCGISSTFHRGFVIDR